jgi:hypothetical protein
LSGPQVVKDSHIKITGEVMMGKFVTMCGFALLFTFTVLTAAYGLEVTADTVTKEGKKTTQGKIYVKDTKVRVEKRSTPIYAIVRGDKGVLWQINGAENTYIEAKLTPDLKPIYEEKLPGEVSRKQVGTETVDTHPTKKYEVSAKRAGKTETYYLWFATDIGFPVKVANANGNWTVEYKNVKKGAADALFELPKGVEIDRTAVPDVLH